MPRSYSSISPEYSKQSPCPSRLGRTRRSVPRPGRNMNIYKLLGSEIVHMDETLMRNETMFDLPRVDAAQLERWNAGGRHPMTAETLDELDVKSSDSSMPTRGSPSGISRKKWTRASAPS